MVWFVFGTERKPKSEDKQTIAMLRSKIYTLEQELEQQRGEQVSEWEERGGVSSTACD